ncbi:RlpA-like double-psi beta-barrel-protein domain-containing protein-containing protein [Armillaria luteobubalina]|uniref:RlpA-like double-psi beta-barrel-protein domain-containing protein-containing protein n=1 Tax=Armillaria luteobubalina TaxID=153913 RepID=A0AA39Q9C2_9AGAR|nr:RlpA-like double-psi beta-barrel-protein domain-containing protein-containing protein [Armillaria luteobubalina]
MFSLRQSVIVVATLSISMVNAFTGDATYYYPNGGLGACGTPLQNSDYIVALSPDQYVGGANCGKVIRVSYEGRTVDVIVRDLCPRCGTNGIDLSSYAFQQLADLDIGRMQVTWDYV